MGCNDEDTDWTGETNRLWCRPNDFQPDGHSFISNESDAFKTLQSQSRRAAHSGQTDYRLHVLTCLAHVAGECHGCANVDLSETSRGSYEEPFSGFAQLVQLQRPGVDGWKRIDAEPSIAPPTISAINGSIRETSAAHLVLEFERLGRSLAGVLFFFSDKGIACNRHLRVPT